MRRFPFLLALVWLAACGAPQGIGPSETSDKSNAGLTQAQTQTIRAAAERFVRVAEVMEPAIEATCRQVNDRANCDYEIVVDERPGQPPNAFQTIYNGRPVIGFTVALILDVQNDDELAFVMAHEGAHHILLHLQRQEQTATQGAVGLGILAALAGGDAATVRQAQRLGAQVGSRAYSKEFELEADRLGAQITQRSGFSALRGAEYFNRIPDPGHEFLGTHPPNAARLETVRDALRS